MDCNYRISGEDTDASYSLSREESGDITTLSVKAVFGERVIPRKFTVTWKMQVVDCYSVWSPSILHDRRLRPNWSRCNSASGLAWFMPLHQINSAGGENRLCVAVSDCVSPINIYSGTCEEDASFDFGIEFFTVPTSPREEYTATIRLDRRKLPFYDALYDAVSWWENECGYKPAHVPDAAREPMDSLWYSFHQGLHPDEILAECERSAKLEMKTVIIDDGWQTDDMNRGYAYCGDWKPAPGKIGDMRALSDRLHAIGMKVMLWFSVPFIGIHSHSYDRFKHMLLDCTGDNKSFFALDPRYKEARDYLSDIYANAVENWQLDGLKLDFIDSFVLNGNSLGDDPRRDCSSLEEAITMLMSDVYGRLREINPEIMVEFRQCYVGPSIRTFGNMLRVSDCPDDALTNRQNTINLRFTSGKTAVHSDMVMWNMNDSTESAALQLASVIFAVPQVSVRIELLPPEHLKMLKFYLDFWRENKSILLDGRLIAQSPESAYSYAASSLDGKAVVALYTESTVEITESKTSVVNAGHEKSVIVKNAAGKIYHVVNCMGDEKASGSFTAALESVEMPTAGIMYIESAAE